MADTIVHRGPDAGGVWVDSSFPLALGHRRLSIIDLSEAGAQPMVSASGRYVLSFNGEIYNFPRLRQEPGLANYSFRGHSDTEVILAAVQHLGVEKAVSKLEGMFALALWDREERCLWLARDRAFTKTELYRFMPKVSHRTAVKYVQTAIEKGLLDETVDEQDRRRRRITMSPQLLKVIEDFLDASLQTFEKRRVFS